MKKKVDNKNNIISRLFKSELRFREEATSEVGTTLLWATMPIWLGAIVMWLLGEYGLIAALKNNISTGELFILSATIMGPIFYMALGESRGLSRFPSKLPHMNYVAIIIAVSAIVFGLQRSHQTIAPDLIVYFSCFVFIISVVLLYTATVCKNETLPDSVEATQEVTTKFTTGYDNHRRDL